MSKFIIYSGGQTGVDRAAWDAAIELGIPQAGWVPKGRIAEDGTIPANYVCEETTTADYAVRTEMNIQDTAATLIVGFGPAKGGTLLTLELCRKWKRPHLWIELDSNGMEVGLQKSYEFLNQFRPHSLNVAGPRGSSRDDVYSRAFEFLKLLFSRYVISLKPNGSRSS